MTFRKLALPEAELDEMIREIRGQRVMLDHDLAKVYGVATKVFNQAVKRNKARFPEDFMFRLTADEVEQVSRSQFVTASSATTRMRSQTVTASKRNVRYRPYAFTEYGALMAANILSSTRAVQMSIFVVRAFARMRETLRAAPDLARKLAALEKKLTGRLDVHEAAIVGVLQKIMRILDPPPGPPLPAKPRIGFSP
jgi:hypothetical protein